MDAHRCKGQNHAPAVVTAKIDVAPGLDDGFDEQTEEFFDYILNTEALEDTETLDCLQLFLPLCSVALKV